ncbi:hypothetical protein Desaci_1984 [Desulfosporosinus acidiphilus SJ4]|uniref:Helix-turn-helix domain-containing protein n=1 Tax=Desulfosporosinus acidiphilus (strain DSM 22704 / JCM 16185 / SJ4) TaxID=646529 RepID=I4D586_DESAJ|nr:hypothetical protein Desaci_1984 [Desulfosporosinus acidiphilus SJ4]
MIMTKNQLLKEFHISRPTLRKLEVDGLPRMQIGTSRSFRYDVDEVKAYLKQKAKQPSVT